VSGRPWLRPPSSACPWWLRPTRLAHPANPAAVPMIPWGGLFCAQRCSEPCCGEVDPEGHEVSDGELPTQQCYDDEQLQFDVEAAPFMSQPSATWAHSGNGGQGWQDSAIPWADLRGPKQQSQNLLFHRGSSQPRALRGIPVASVQARGPSPSVNPYSRFGFMTASRPACEYKVDPSDVVDVELYRCLLALEQEAQLALVLRRLAPSRYEIDGRLVTMSWGGERGDELFAHEEQSSGQSAVDPPLPAYVEQVASIAARVRRPLAPRTLTFVDQENTVPLAKASANDRWESMEIACEQARLREEAAEGAGWQATPALAPAHPRPQGALWSASWHPVSF